MVAATTVSNLNQYTVEGTSINNMTQVANLNQYTVEGSIYAGMMQVANLTLYTVEGLAPTPLRRRILITG